MNKLTHTLPLHGATIRHNEDNTAAQVELDGVTTEFKSDAAKPGKNQPEPTATMQAVQFAKQARKDREAAAEAETLAKRQEMIDAAKKKTEDAAEAKRTPKQTSK